MLETYEAFYKLNADPFRLGPDHRFAFGHPSYARSKAYLQYALHRGEGFVTITGAPGTGKTTLINEILAELNKTRIQVAKLSSTQLEARDLLHMVAGSFGLPLEETDKATLLLGLEQFLTEQSRKGRRAVLIVDEAQDLPPGAVEELRLLANLQHNHRMLLQVCLVGQEQLRELLAKPDMEHLRQRIVAASHLEPLDLDQTISYIEHRLQHAGWRGDPEINEDALRYIHRFSGGTPRRINLICSRLFLYGTIEGKHALLGEDARLVIKDLQQELLVSPVEAEAQGEIREQGEDKGKASARHLPRDRSVSRGEPSVQRPPRPTSRPQATAAAPQARNVALESATPGDEEPWSSAPELPDDDVWREIADLKRELVEASAHLEDAEANSDAVVQVPGPTVTSASAHGLQADSWSEKPRDEVQASPTPSPGSRMTDNSPAFRRTEPEAGQPRGKKRSSRFALTVLLLVGVLLAIGGYVMALKGVLNIDWLLFD